MSSFGCGIFEAGVPACVAVNPTGVAVLAGNACNGGAKLKVQKDLSCLVEEANSSEFVGLSRETG